jgi:hypothetical protein
MKALYRGTRMKASHRGTSGARKASHRGDPRDCTLAQRCVSISINMGGYIHI